MPYLPSRTLRLVQQLVFAMLVLCAASASAQEASGETGKESARLCDTGEVIWDSNGNRVGCKFNTWGSYQISQCNGAVSILPSPGGNCYVCVVSSYVPVINDPNQWSSVTVGTHYASSVPGDFTCLGQGCVEPIDEGEALDSNRSNGLLNDTFQAVMFYDGSSAQDVELRFQYIDVDGEVCWQTLDQIQPFTSKIVTRQLDLRGAKLTGNVEVAGATGNLGINGLAFGFFWKDAAGRYHLLKSNAESPTYLQHFVGSWPLAMGEGTFTSRTPQLTNGYSRSQARSTLHGAALLGNGNYFFNVF